MSYLGVKCGWANPNIDAELEDLAEREASDQKRRELRQRDLDDRDRTENRMLAEFDWDRYNDINYLRRFVERWPFTGFAYKTR